MPIKIGRFPVVGKWWWENLNFTPNFPPSFKEKIAQNTSVMALIKSHKGSTSRSANVVIVR